MPLGRNWVHSLENALTSTALMLVFVSGAALQSNWIYFEAGYAYSRKVQVVPIGMPGIDLAQLAPPLSLLQGFNLKSHEGLNNIIALLNSVFNCSYPPTFVEADFNSILGGPNEKGRAVFGPYADLIDRLFLVFKNVKQDLHLNQIPLLMKAEDIGWQQEERVLRTYGMAVAKEDEGNEILISIVPVVATFALTLVDSMASQFTWDRRYGYQFGLRLASHVKYQEDPERRSAAFLGAGVQFYSVNDIKGYQLGDIRFRFHHRQAGAQSALEEAFDAAPQGESLWIMVAYDRESIKDLDLSPLLATLYDSGVLTLR
jgi:hypothetical protein